MIRISTDIANLYQRYTLSKGSFLTSIICVSLKGLVTDGGGTVADIGLYNSAALGSLDGSVASLSGPIQPFV